MISFIETPRKILFSEDDLLVKYTHAENFRRFHRARYRRVDGTVFKTIMEKTPKDVIELKDPISE